jgi:hypothetical protein
MFIALIILALLTLAVVVQNHGRSVYDDWPESWASDKAFWNHVPRA